MWSERRHSSKDAAHATRVVGAILRKVSMQDPATARSPPPPPPPPKPEVRDGSLASLLNNDVQPAPSSTLFDSMILPIDFSMDFVPLDTVLNNHSSVDWVRIVGYLSLIWVFAHLFAGHYRPIPSGQARQRV